MSKPVGRPPDTRVHQAILDSTTILLEQKGYQKLTIEGIARHAKVGKPAIYRRWRHKALLVYDAVFGQFAPAKPPDTGSLESDLAQILADTVSKMEPPVAAEAIAGLIAEFKADPKIQQQVFDQWLEPVGRVFDVIIIKAIERGEIRADIDARIVLDSLVGMVFFRTLMVKQPVDQNAQRTFIQMILRGIQYDGVHT